MERLKGKNILIGKEPSQNKLVVAVETGGKLKAVAIGSPQSVPDSVSRYIADNDISNVRAHCKISVGKSGGMVVENLNPNNTTCVGGMAVMSKKIDMGSKVALGLDKYALDLEEVLDAAKKLASPEGYDLTPLEKVWNRYHDSLLQIQLEQRKLGLLNRLYFPISILSGGLGFVLSAAGVNAAGLSYVLYGIGGVVMFYGLYKSFKDKSIEERERVTEEFQRDYVCPNPDCRHFLGNQPYNILRQNQSCPYCKSKFLKR